MKASLKNVLLYQTIYCLFDNPTELFMDSSYTIMVIQQQNIETKITNYKLQILSIIITITHVKMWLLIIRYIDTFYYSVSFVFN